MSEQTKQIAERVVSRLLGEDYASKDDFESRPGGSKDPHRQTTLKIGFKKKDFTGKRAKGAVASGPGPVKGSKHPGEKEEEVTAEKPSRFKMKFEAKSAMKKGKSMHGKAVASKPGKVSYKEALMISVLEKLKMKKAGKGKMVASKPGKVSYKGESKRPLKEYFEPEPQELPSAPEPESAPMSWEDFWMSAKHDAATASGDEQFCASLQHYLELGGVTNYAGLSCEQFAQRVASTPDQTWQQFGERVTALRDAWELEHGGDPAEAPGEELEPHGEEPPGAHGEPEAPPAMERDRPPHVESLSEGNLNGVKGRAKKMLGLVSKGPGKVQHGKK